MTKVEIRNRKSPKQVKPRLFDAIVDDDKKITFEVKKNGNIERIPLEDVYKQIDEALTTR